MEIEVQGKGYTVSYCPKGEGGGGRGGMGRQGGMGRGCITSFLKERWSFVYL